MWRWNSLLSCFIANGADDGTREQMLPVCLSCLIICIVCSVALFSVHYNAVGLWSCQKAFWGTNTYSLNLMQMAWPRHSAAKCKITGFLFGCVDICKLLSVWNCAHSALSYECELNCIEFIHFSTTLLALILSRAWEARQASPVNNALHLVLCGSLLASFQHSH